MEAVINDLVNLKKYMTVNKEKKEITFKFDDVIFNCSLPSKMNFNYFQDDNIKDYTINIKAKNINFNYYAECDNIYANNVVSEDSIVCKLLNVIGDTRGGYISADVFMGINIEANTFAVKRICCKKIKAGYLVINDENYFYIKADSVNNIGV